MRNLFAPLAAFLVIGCAADTSSPAVADHLELIRGGAQVGTVGRPLDSLVVARLVDDQGRPMPNAEVTWSLPEAGGTVRPVSTTTGSDGTVAASWTLGITTETQTLSVVYSGVPTLAVGATATAFRATAIAVGENYGCGLNEIGDAWCWGGFLYVPKHFGSRPVKVDSGHAFVGITAATDHVCAWDAQGAARCWGQLSYLGRGVLGSEYADPAPVQGGVTFAKVTAGERSTCGLDTAGQAWCWGPVATALGSTDAWVNGALVPKPVDQSGNIYTSLTIGFDHACALDTGGRAWCWGDNHDHEVGDSAFGSGPAIQPRAVTTGLRFTTLANGDSFTCGSVGGNGTWCWGEDWFGLNG
jgi:hypothetical protein